MESLQKMKSEVNNDISSNISVSQQDITKLNIDALVNSVNKTLIDSEVLMELFMTLQGQDCEMNVRS